MKRIFFIVLTAVVYCFVAAGQQSSVITERYFSDPDVIFVTPSLSIDEERLASYDEVMEWISHNISGKPGAEVRIIGQSERGIDIPVIYLRRPGQAPKLRIWMQGVLHGNEPSGVEGLLHLALQLLDDEETSGLLDHLSVAILPIANVDGYVANTRASARGLDLNRDQTRFADPVSVIIKKAFMEWSPDVAADFHEYTPSRRDYSGFGNNGATISYDVKFVAPGSLILTEGQRRASYEILQKEAEKVLDEYGYTHFFYFTSSMSGGEMVLSAGAQTPHSSSTSYALSNAVSFFVETRGIGLGRTSLARRAHGVYLTALSMLESSVRHKDEIRDIVETAKRETIMRSNDIVVVAVPAESYHDVIFIDLKTAEPIVKRLKTLDSRELTPVLVRSRPKGYIIESATEREISILRILGLEVVPLERNMRYRTESYIVQEHRVAGTMWEGIYPVTVTTDIKSGRKRFGRGDYYVDLAQENANYAVVLLEPESANGFVNYAVTAAQSGKPLRIHRVVK